MRALWFLLAIILAASCGEGSQRGQRSAAGCITSCKQVGAVCGVINDGCGGILECPNCPLGEVCGGPEAPNQCVSEPCEPRLCEADECGTVSDGCDGLIDCKTCAPGYECKKNSCVCKEDAAEPNNSAGSMHDLRVGRDSTGLNETLTSLTLTGSDVDWFQMKMIDDAPFRNPVIRFKPHADDGVDVAFYVSLYFKCTAGGEGHACPGSTPTGDGRGCERLLKSSEDDWIELEVDCHGGLEYGTVSVEIRQECGEGGCDDSCHLYSLRYQLSEGEGILGF